MVQQSKARVHDLEGKLKADRQAVVTARWQQCAEDVREAHFTFVENERDDILPRAMQQLGGQYSAEMRQQMLYPETVKLLDKPVAVAEGAEAIPNRALRNFTRDVQERGLASYNEVPHELLCPITLSIFRDPVIAGDGFTYERKAIEAELKKTGRSPFTRQQIGQQVEPNVPLRRLIFDLSVQGRRLFEAASANGDGAQLQAPVVGPSGGGESSRFCEKLMIMSNPSVSGSCIRLPKKFMTECSNQLGGANELYFQLRASNGRAVIAGMEGNSWVKSAHLVMAPASMLQRRGMRNGTHVDVTLVNGDGAYDASEQQERPWLVQMGTFDRFEVRMEDAVQWALAASVPMEGAGGLKKALETAIDKHHPVVRHGDLITFECEGKNFTVRVSKLYMPETECRREMLGAMQLTIMTATQPPLTITIDADPSDTANDLMRLIEEKVQVPAEQQRLFATGEELISGSTLSSQGICQGSTIRLQSSLDAAQMALFGAAALGSSSNGKARQAEEEAHGRRYRRDVPVVVRKLGGGAHGFDILGPR
jgi:hypothetical protein